MKKVDMRLVVMIATLFIFSLIMISKVDNKINNVNVKIEQLEKDMTKLKERIKF